MPRAAMDIEAGSRARRAGKREHGSCHCLLASSCMWLCSATIMVVFIIIFACSWSAVRPNQVGLHFNTLTKELDRHSLYEPGRYYVGPFAHLIPFQRGVSRVQFLGKDALTTRTGEGLALKLEVSFEFMLELKVDRLADLYTQFGNDWRSTFLKVAKESILATASEFVGTDYFRRRRQVQLALRTGLDDALSPLHARVPWVHLLAVQLPKEWEESIAITQVEQQNVRKATFLQEARVIRAATRTIVAEAERNSTAILASSQAKALLVSEQAQWQLDRFQREGEAAAYSRLMDALALNSTQLQSYLRLKAVRKHDNARLTMGLPLKSLR
eukprot:PLAT14517.1.p1 GENE.PLAT14517.1~~PLAT14517.1.p1  ORF type:complete len:328 (+),score=125.77 PLAT14517.1:143-1126(+)